MIRRVMEPKRGPEILIRECLLPHLRDSYADLTAAAHGADLLVTHPITFAGPLVAERDQIPWVSTVLAPMSFFSVYDLPVLPACAVACAALPAEARCEPAAPAPGEVDDAPLDGAYSPAAGRARTAGARRPPLRRTVLARAHARPVLPRAGQTPAGLAAPHPGHGVCLP